MATIKVRTRRDGTPTFRVVWRDGGSREGLWESETFATKRDADRWKKAVRLAQRQGLRAAPRFHDLRHTHAAWLISAGVPLPVIQQRLGHESITTTVDIYGGLLLQAHDAADAAIDAALGGRSVPAPSPVAPAQSAGGGARPTATPAATGTGHRAGAAG